MRYFLALLLFIAPAFAAKNYEICHELPYYNPSQGVFDKVSALDPDRIWGTWEIEWDKLITRVVQKGGIVIHTSNSTGNVYRVDSNRSKRTIKKMGMKRLKESVSRNIYFNRPVYYKDEAFKRIPKRKKIMFLLEPPSVIPEQYTREFLSQFEKVYSWHNDWVDGKHIVKFYHPVLRPAREAIPVNERSFMCMVTANKESPHPHELYSKRRKLMHYFMHRPDFHLYGPAWDPGLPCYKGMCEYKVETMRRYKFAICLENISSCPGYISEKIFDAFAALCIPIYEGDPDVTDEIPANCFIDLRKFSSFKELENYLTNMSDEEFQGYIQNIQEFLKSPQAQKFSGEAFERLLEKEFLD